MKTLSGMTGLGAACFWLVSAAHAADDDLAARFASEVAAQRHTVEAIGGMAVLDQYVRLTFLDARQDESLTPKARKAFEEKAGAVIDGIDAENTKRLKVILARVSWADLARIKPDVAADAFTIVQHSDDLAFQEETLAAIEPLARAGQMDGSMFAAMFDRIARTKGQKQRYGTQTRCEGGAIVLQETEAPEALDARRAELGLPPVDAYMSQIKKMYEPC